MKRSVAVTIAGQRYPIKSDAEESYVQSLAQMVDDKVKEVQRGAKTAPLQAVAVLAALQIAAIEPHPVYCIAKREQWKG